jgi:hypothetical protein
VTDEQVNALIRAIEEISLGSRGPGGLEALAMAFAGTGISHPVSEAISEGSSLVASSIEDLADAVRELAQAVAEKK